MVSRAVVAGVIAACGLALVIPVETFAKSGGATGRSGSFGGRSAASHSSLPAKSLNSPSSGMQRHAHARSLIHRNHLAHRHNFGRGVAWAAGGFYSTNPYYVPWDVVHQTPPADAYPSAPADITLPPPSPQYVDTAPRRCTTETVSVPGSDGKQQSVNIVRC